MAFRSNWEANRKLIAVYTGMVKTDSLVFVYSRFNKFNKVLNYSKHVTELKSDNVAKNNNQTLPVKYS